MAKLHMSSVNKKLLGAASLLLVGCTPVIPEGDIKDFLANISFENTYSNVNYGKSIIEVKHNQDENVVLGELTIINEFDKVNDAVVNMWGEVKADNVMLPYYIFLGTCLGACLTFFIISKIKKNKSTRNKRNLEAKHK